MGILSGPGLQAIGISFRQRTWLYFVRAMRLGVKSSLNVINSSIIPEISKNPSIQATLWVLLVPFSQVCREDQVWKAETKVGKTGMLARKDCVPAPFLCECKLGYDWWGPLWAPDSLFYPFCAAPQLGLPGGLPGLYSAVDQKYIIVPIYSKASGFFDRTTSGFSVSPVCRQLLWMPQEKFQEISPTK